MVDGWVGNSAKGFAGGGLRLKAGVGLPSFGGLTALRCGELPFTRQVLGRGSVRCARRGRAMRCYPAVGMLLSRVGVIQHAQCY